MSDHPLPMEKHPCYNAKAKGQFGRIHLPVAPKCNIQCNYCSRKTDCVNESRPGVTSKVLTPVQAVDYLLKVLAVEPRISTVGIAGPGDPFANADATLLTCQLIRDVAPEMLLCLSTNGLGLDESVLSEIVRIGVSHMTLTVNAVDPVIGARMYSWMRDEDRTLHGLEAAQLLLDRQMDAIVGLKGRGVQVKVNTVVVPGVNDAHVGRIARMVAALGADVHNLIAMTPVAGTPFQGIREPEPKEMMAARRLSSPYMEQMTHCSRCRADAVGLLGEDRSAEFSSCLAACAAKPASGARVESTLAA